MKRFILIIIFFVSTNIIFGQTNNYDGIVARQIWGVGHTISNDGEKNFLTLYPENIKNLPENIKPLLIRFASYIRTLSRIKINKMMSVSRHRDVGKNPCRNILYCFHNLYWEG